MMLGERMANFVGAIIAMVVAPHTKTKGSTGMNWTVIRSAVPQSAPPLRLHPSGESVWVKREVYDGELPLSFGWKELGWWQTDDWMIWRWQTGIWGVILVGRQTKTYNSKNRVRVRSSRLSELLSAGWRTAVVLTLLEGYICMYK